MVTFDLLNFLLSIVFAGQVHADRSDSKEEQKAAEKQKEDAGNPNGFRFKRGAAPDHQKQADDKDEAGQAAAEQTQIEVSTWRLFVQIIVTFVRGAAAAVTARRGHQIARCSETADTSGVTGERVTGGRHVGRHDEQRLGFEHIEIHIDTSPAKFDLLETKAKATI